MKRLFKGSLITLGSIFLVSAILFGFLVAAPEGSALFNLATGLLVTGMCISPLVVLTAIVTGIGTLVNYFRYDTKRKRDFDHNIEFMDSDEQLETIMEQLSPEQQEYLQQKLRNKRLGIGTDGEIVSMNDLLDDDYEQKEQS